MKSHFRLISALCLAALIIAGIFTATGCDNQPGFLKGITFTPRSFQQQDVTDFFEKAQQTGDLVSWAGDWAELGNSASGAPTVVAELAKTYQYLPVIEAQFFIQATGELLRPLDEATKMSYRESAVAFAKKYQPRYFAFGIEVNLLYEKSAQEFDRFASFFDEIYDAVKAVSPKTSVFTIFQLEKMKGLGGGLFGGTNDPGNAQWQLLDRFSKADVIVFTTYPCLIYKDPAEIPPDYYADISSHTSKKIGFTEIGWHSAANPAGWESGEAEQASFIDTFFSLTEGLQVEMVIWSFMYDQNTFEPFNSMGLRRSDGSAKPAWDVWGQ